MNQSKEIKQIWTETENFDDICIFWLLLQVLFLEERLGTKLCL